MSISKKMLGVLAMMTVIVLLCVTIPLLTARGLNGVTRDLAKYDELQAEIGLTQELQLQVANVWQFITDASLTKDKEVIEKEAKPAYLLCQSIISKLVAFNKDDAAHLAALKAIQQDLPGMWTTGNRMFEAYGSSFQEGNKAMDEYDAVCDRVIKKAAAIAAKSRQDGKADMRLITGRLSALTRQVIGSGGIAAAICLLVMVGTVILRRSIVRQLELILDEVGCLAKCDLTRRFDAEGSDEIATVSRMLNHLQQTLSGVVRNISDTSAEIASAARQLSATAGQIADGAADVAAQSATAATAGEEMSATSGNIAQNCFAAAEGSQLASHAARNGAEVVENTVQVMEQIANRVKESARTVEGLGARSDQIGAIVGTIDEIADQTNLLALNAAIEAARAGEQGRGFAVVADEVRALADRTSRATGEISDMIKTIQQQTKEAVAVMEQGVHQVEKGTAEAGRSGEALRAILEHVNDVARQLNEIATAAEQQTSATCEISGNMRSIKEVVQQTSDGAKESATVASRLSGNADVLQQLVQQFKL